jgi:hypothetical protein
MRTVCEILRHPLPRRKCIACHSQLENVSKLKANSRFPTGDVEKKLKNTAASLDIAMAQSGIVSIRTE